MSLLMDEMEWQQRVISLRHRMSITQEALAALLGVSRATVSMWETRSSRPYSKSAELFTALEAEVNEKGMEIGHEVAL